MLFLIRFLVPFIALFLKNERKKEREMRATSKPPTSIRRKSACHWPATLKKLSHFYVFFLPFLFSFCYSYSGLYATQGFPRPRDPSFLGQFRVDWFWGGKTRRDRFEVELSILGSSDLDSVPQKNSSKMFCAVFKGYSPWLKTNF